MVWVVWGFEALVLVDQTRSHQLEGSSPMGVPGCLGAELASTVFWRLWPHRFQTALSWFWKISVDSEEISAPAELAYDSAIGSVAP